MQQIKSKLCQDNSYMDLEEEKEKNIKRMNNNNELIINLNNIIEEKENNPLLYINGEINKDLQKTIIQDHNNLKQTYLNNTRKIKNKKSSKK